MNIPNSINITNMTNKFGDLKNYLKLLSPKERLNEINFMINEFNKSNRNGENIGRKIHTLNELKVLKNT